jgi:hypothetical protein
LIRIARTAEPPALAKTREEQLSRARALVALGEKPKLTGYDVAKPALFEMQHRKCRYSEKLEEQAKYRDVEHYRPKSIYWWLTWSWENLLFACVDCNREHKKGQFPLVDETKRLQAEDDPPQGEQPLILDPCGAEFNPLLEIDFRRERVGGLERWRPHGTTPRGWKTIEVCGLDRPTLLDLYRAHVNDRVRPRAEEVLEAHGRGDARSVVQLWCRAKRSLLGPHSPFRSLSHHALAVLVSPDVRATYQLDLDLRSLAGQFA